MREFEVWALAALPRTDHVRAKSKVGRTFGCLMSCVMISNREPPLATGFAAQALTPTIQKEVRMAEAEPMISPSVKFTPAALIEARRLARNAVKEEWRALAPGCGITTSNNLRKPLTPISISTETNSSAVPVQIFQVVHNARSSDIQRELLCRYQVQMEAGMIVGYARVSTDGQTLDAQHAALMASGAEKVFAEKVSGAVADRKALARAIDALGPGDVLLVTRSIGSPDQLGTLSTCLPRSQRRVRASARSPMLGPTRQRRMGG